MRIIQFFIDHKRIYPYNTGNIHKVLFLRDDDKIGDMVVSTIAFRDLKNAGLTVSVLAGKNNRCVIENNPNIDEIYLFPESFFAKLTLAWRLKKENFDLVIDMGDRLALSYLIFLRVINARHMVGFNKEKFNIYDISLTYQYYEQHITTRYRMLLEKLGIFSNNLDYQIFSSVETKESVDNFLAPFSTSKIIVINPFTANTKRDMSLTQLNELVKGIQKAHSNICIIIIGAAQRLESIQIENVHKNPLASLLSASEIISKAALVISPDTSIVHIAAAYKKPLIALYGHDIHDQFINSKVWAPGYSQATQIYTADKNQPISSIPVTTLLTQVERYLSESISTWRNPN